METTENLGVLGQHRARSENDPAYREAAMTAPSITDKTGISAKYLPNTAPTKLSADQGKATAASDGPDKYDELTGDDLEQAVRDADIEGRSGMTADEKRQALRDKGA